MTIAEREEYYKEQEIRISLTDFNYDEPPHNIQLQDKAHQQLKEEGIYGQYDFFFGIEEFFNASIDESLKSEDAFILLLCMIDRRVRKRTLRKLESQLKQIHPLVGYFYRLRCEAKNIQLAS